MEHYPIVIKVNLIWKFDEIHQVVLDGICDNMASLVESWTYGSIKITGISTNGFLCYHVHIRCIYTKGKHNNWWKIITAGELVVKAKYICSMQIDTNWYWNQQPKHHVVTVPTRKILHPELEVNVIADFHTITTNICSRTQA